jgi:acyl-ACP thioesterase
MPIASNFTSVFSKDWEINFTQCLPNGFLKCTDLCNLLQLTAGDHAEMGGISFTDMQEFHQAWVLSRMRIEITRLPKWREVVTVKTWIVSLENSRSVRALEMYVGNEKVVGCETYWAVFNTKIRRPEALALPHEHFEKFPDWLPSEARVRKINFPEEMELINERAVVLSDLDIVNHVNNVKYLEWCLDLVDSKLLLKQRLQSFDMNFMKELMLGDPVAITGSETENTSVYAVAKDGKACFALELNWK